MSAGDTGRLTPQQSARRERTLVAAIALSAFGPFATGAAVLMSRSSTQMADFVRRTVELAAMIVSWLVFRHLARAADTPAVRRAHLERVANLGVAAAMAISAVVLAVLALAPRDASAPYGNVYPGLAIAVMGLAVNAWFRRRYSRMTRERFDAIIAAQARLYLGKTAVDCCVAVALAAVALAPMHPVTALVDPAGSLAVAGYLGWCAFRTARSAM